MIRFESWYKYIRLLSLDVVTGACIMCGFFSRFFDTPISLSIYFCLAVTVWLVYTIDHLLDAQQLKERAISDRHKWHYKYAHDLWAASVVMTYFLFDVAFSLPTSVFWNGIYLGVAVMVYFILIQIPFLKKMIPKEPLIAVMYSLGIFLPIFSLRPSNLLVMASFVFLVFLVALLNLLIISLVEFASDRKVHMSSMTTIFGDKPTIYLIWLVFILFFAGVLFFGVVYFDMNNYLDYVEVLLLMGLVLLLIFIKRKLFIPEELYRILGDSVFLLPAFFMWINDFN